MAPDQRRTGGALMTSRVRINLANPMELLELPGISPQQAMAIVKFRAEHGPIRDAAELARILRGWRRSDAALERLDFDPADSTAPESPGA
jgi:helix-hairpin-helix protein